MTIRRQMHRDKVGRTNHRLTPETPVTEALEIIGRENVHQLPVVSNGQLKGMISRRSNNEPTANAGRIENVSEMDEKKQPMRPPGLKAAHSTTSVSKFPRVARRKEPHDKERNCSTTTTAKD